MTAPPAYTLRDATPADVADVHRLVRGLAEYERKLDKFTATPADYHRVLFGPRPYAQAIVAEAGGRVVGVALYHTTISTFSCHPGYFLEDLFIEAEHRGSGLGRALFAELARAEMERALHRLLSTPGRQGRPGRMGHDEPFRRRPGAPD